MSFKYALHLNLASNRSHANVSQLKGAPENQRDNQAIGRQQQQHQLRKVKKKKQTAITNNEVACETNRISIKYIMDSNVFI